MRKREGGSEEEGGREGGRERERERERERTKILMMNACTPTLHVNNISIMPIHKHIHMTSWASKTQNDVLSLTLSLEATSTHSGLTENIMLTNTDSLPRLGKALHVQLLVLYIHPTLSLSLSFSFPLSPPLPPPSLSHTHTHLICELRVFHDINALPECLQHGFTCLLQLLCFLTGIKGLTHLPYLVLEQAVVALCLRETMV